MDKMTTFDDLLKVLPTVDIIISILPSTQETHHLLKAEHFKAMKDSAIFMNFGRGDLVETNILKEALLQKRLLLLYVMYLKKSHCLKIIRFGTWIILRYRHMFRVILPVTLNAVSKSLNLI